MSKGPQIETTRTTEAFIESAFLLLYEQMPFEQISVSQLIEQAHCSRRTFYRYYPNLEALLEAVEDRYTCSEESRFILENIRTIPMETASDIVTTFYDKHAKAVKALVLGSRAKAYIDKQRAVIKPVMAALVGRAYKMPPMQMEYLSDYLARAKVGQIEIWAEHNCEVSVTQITRMTDTIIESTMWTNVALQQPSLGGPKPQSIIVTNRYGFPWDDLYTKGE